LQAVTNFVLHLCWLLTTAM